MQWLSSHGICNIFRLFAHEWRYVEWQTGLLDAVLPVANRDHPALNSGQLNKYVQTEQSIMSFKCAEFDYGYYGIRSPSHSLFYSNFWSLCHTNLLSQFHFTQISRPQDDAVI